VEKLSEETKPFSWVSSMTAAEKTDKIYLHRAIHLYWMVLR